MSPLLWQPLLMPEFPSVSSSRPVHRIHPLRPPGPLSGTPYLLWSHGRLWVPSPRTPGAAGDLRNWPHVLKTPMVISRTLVLHHTEAYWSILEHPGSTFAFLTHLHLHSPRKFLARQREEKSPTESSSSTLPKCLVWLI